MEITISPLVTLLLGALVATWVTFLVIWKLGPPARAGKANSRIRLQDVLRFVEGLATFLQHYNQKNAKDDSTNQREVAPLDSGKGSE